MFKIRINKVVYELPITDCEWTCFVLDDGNNIVEYIIDAIDSDLTDFYRWHAISNFNRWIIENFSRFTFSTHNEFIDISHKALEMHYYVYKDPEHDVSSNDNTIWEMVQKLNSTK